MSAPQPWYALRASDRMTPPPLPASAPLYARLVHGVYYAVTPEIRADMRAGHNSRRVGIAFDQIDTRAVVPLRLSRRERGEGIAYLVKLEASRGGVLS
ncbi:hypothetical protein [Microbacterium wangruii]|uniref:hypothetical protein n=1 Tax=Microbacterium wangruii TaxID=3049073 RepID=UPI00256E9C66|nr:hypothetical protein [Microbacterium sp. zg-Y1211]MDL5487130.1 hypothetical protein [Microbacterium sp. zg-Y1211]